MKVNVDAIKTKIASNKKASVVVLVILAVLLAGGYFVYNMRKTVDLKDYISIDYEGFDGKARATAIIDSEALKDAYAGVITLTKNGKIMYEDEESSSDDEIVSLFLRKCVKSVQIESDNNGSLENGDILKVKISIDEYKAKEYFGVNCETKNYEFTVESLEGITEVDPFEKISVEFSGISGSGSAEVVKPGDDEFYNYIYFEISERQGLSEGDIITVTASSYDDIETIHGKTLSSTTKEYTVADLDEYISTESDIPDVEMEKIIEQGNDIIMEKVVSTWNNSDMLNSITPVGNILLTVKDEMAGSYGTNHNQLALVYKIKTNAVDDIESTEYYYVVEYKNILKSADDELDINLSSYTTYSSYKYRFTAGNMTYYGFQTIDEIKNDVITANQVKYTSENNLD